MHLSMNKILFYICSLLVIGMVVSCKKNDPITELGTTNGEFAGTLRVSYNNTRPAIGDTLVITAAVSQRDDRLDRVVFYETVFETFGMTLQLEKGTSLETRIPIKDSSTLMITDTIKVKSIWKEVLRTNLDDYWVTVSNQYVVRGDYKVNKLEGKYPNDMSLINELSDNDFDVLKSLLAYAINRDDYLSLFPGAPATHYTTTGLTQLGINHLKANLTKAILLPAVKSVIKTGIYSVIIEVDVITPTGATTTATRTFDNNL